jgi:hypothetical protein
MFNPRTTSAEGSIQLSRLKKFLCLFLASLNVSKRICLICFLDEKDLERRQLSTRIFNVIPIYFEVKQISEVTDRDSLSEIV